MYSIDFSLHLTLRTAGLIIAAVQQESAMKDIVTRVGDSICFDPPLELDGEYFDYAICIGIHSLRSRIVDVDATSKKRPPRRLILEYDEEGYPCALKHFLRSCFRMRLVG